MAQGIDALTLEHPLRSPRSAIARIGDSQRPVKDRHTGYGQGRQPRPVVDRCSDAEAVRRECRALAGGLLAARLNATRRSPLGGLREHALRVVRDSVADF